MIFISIPHLDKKSPAMQPHGNQEGKRFSKKTTDNTSRRLTKGCMKDIYKLIPNMTWISGFRFPGGGSPLQTSLRRVRLTKALNISFVEYQREVCTIGEQGRCLFRIFMFKILFIFLCDQNKHSQFLFNEEIVINFLIKQIAFIYYKLSTYLIYFLYINRNVINLIHYSYSTLLFSAMNKRNNRLVVG